MKLSCGKTFLFCGVELNRALHQLLSPNTSEPQEGRQLLEMAEEDQTDASQQAATRDKDEETGERASPSVIEIHDSTTECEEDARPSKALLEEKGFISSLHSFMKDKGTPIERIPHLGFKQINLWRIYKAVDKLGGYDSVTARRLWKKVYDELGGSPGSTSAATCTRRHYERLVLPFERRMKGEEDKPLPPSKPRKPYKRSLDGKVSKCDVKRKKGHMDREMASELLIQGSPEALCQSDTRVMHPHPVLWPPQSDRMLSSDSQPPRAGADLCTPVYAHILQSPASTSWMASIPPAAGEVISPLEKKKRMAQASLSLPRSCQCEDKERPSVIHSSLSPARTYSSRNISSSDGSPLPLSSSSSRSPSPLSDSSEEGAARGHRISAMNLEQNGSSRVRKICDSKGEDMPAGTGQTSKDLTGQRKDVSQVRSQALTSDTLKNLDKDSAWSPHYKGTGKYLNYPFHSLPSFSSPTSTSSFTKVIPKSTQLLRPAPIRPGSKIPPTRLLQQVDSQACAKKLNSVSPWSYQTDKKEKSRATLQKLPAVPQNLIHSTSTLPAPCILPGYNKPGRDSRPQPLIHPAYMNHRARLPHCQLLYRHPPLGPAVIGAAVFPYPYTFPLLNPQTGYTIPAMHHIYSHKL